MKKGEKLFNEKREFDLRAEAEQILKQATQEYEFDGEDYLRTYVFLMNSSLTELQRLVKSIQQQNQKLVRILNKLSRAVEQLNKNITAMYNTDEELYQSARTLLIETGKLRKAIYH